MSKETDKRWRVVCVYRSEVGPVDVEHFIEELCELDDLIERGPNFYAIDHIRIEHTGRCEPMTLRMKT